MGISMHKNYLNGKKQTIKSSMFKCLLNDNHLLEILQFCNNCNCQNFEICDIRKRLKNILEILKNSECFV